MIGATATTAQAAAQAQADGADYIGFGPVFRTGSKANPASVKGLGGLAETCAAVTIPVVAIAGITPERVAPCLDAGAWGVAVMTAVTTAIRPHPGDGGVSRRHRPLAVDADARRQWERR